MYLARLLLFIQYLFTAFIIIVFLAFVVVVLGIRSVVHSRPIGLHRRFRYFKLLAFRIRLDIHDGDVFLTMVAESINAAGTIAALVTVVAFDDNLYIASVIRGSIVFVKQVRHVHQLSQQNSLSSQLNSEAKQTTLNRAGRTQIQNKRGESSEAAREC